MHLDLNGILSANLAEQTLELEARILATEAGDRASLRHPGTILQSLVKMSLGVSTECVYI
jgi:hypothetical protein